MLIKNKNNDKNVKIINEKLNLLKIYYNQYSHFELLINKLIIMLIIVIYNTDYSTDYLF